MRASAVRLLRSSHVLVVQFFRKVPALHVLAPTESELPFAIAAEEGYAGASLIFGAALTRSRGRSHRLSMDHEHRLQALQAPRSTIPLRPCDSATVNALERGQARGAAATPCFAIDTGSH